MVSKPRKTPTFKQKLFAQEYVKNKGNGTKSALAVYDTTYTGAKEISRQNIKKPVIKEEIENILHKKGLTIDRLVDWSKDSIENNLSGKPSQAVASDMLKFLFKLYNVVPATKSMKLSYNKSEQLPSQDILEVKRLLTELNENTNKILQDMNK